MTGAIGLVNVPLAFLTDSQFLCKLVSARFKSSLMALAVVLAKRESAMSLGVAMTASSLSGLSGVNALLRVLAPVPTVIKLVAVASFDLPAHASRVMSWKTHDPVKCVVLEIARFRLGLAGLGVVLQINVQRKEMMAHLGLLFLVALIRARSSTLVKFLFNQMNVVYLVLIPPENWSVILLSLVAL